MRKLLFSLGLVISSLALNAQISKHAIGLRVGGGLGYGNEITYQFRVSEVNRFQFDLGTRDNSGINAFSLTGTYQWVADLPEFGENFRWYYGGGAGFGFLDRNNILITDNNYNIVNVVGIVGVEYDFKTTADLPLLVSADINPAFNLFNNNIDNLDLNLALSLRWQFD